MPDDFGWFIAAAVFWLAILTSPWWLARLERWAEARAHIVHIDEDGRCPVCGRVL